MWGKVSKFVGTEEVLDSVDSAEPDDTFLSPPDDDYLESDVHEGRKVTWLGTEGFLVRIPRMNVHFTEGNAWNFGHAKVLYNAMLDEPDRKFEVPAGRVYRVMASDVKLSQKYEKAGDLEYQMSMLEPWTREEIGEYYVQLLDGNHRAAAALLAGEPYIFVYIGQDYRENVRKKDLE